MENINDYEFEFINRKVRPFLEESFINADVNECQESELVQTATNRGRMIPDANYEETY